MCINFVDITKLTLENRKMNEQVKVNTIYFNELEIFNQYSFLCVNCDLALFIFNCSKSKLNYLTNLNMTTIECIQP